MKFVLLPHLPRQDKSDGEQLQEIVATATLAEQLGFDGFGIGERHDRPAVSSSPAVLLSHIAARTSTIRLFTTVTTLGLHDPLRAFEDYSTLDHLSAGRLEMVIGKGAYAATQKLFGVTSDDQWQRLADNYELFRRLWTEDRVSWQGRFRPALADAEALPRPRNPRLRVWHGSATSRQSVELAAKYGDPVFSANGGGPIEAYAELIRHYREQFAANGHSPDDARVGIGTAGFFAARTSQEAVEKYRPVFDEIAIKGKYNGARIPFDSVEDWIAGGSLLVGSPQQIIDKIHHQYQHFGHELFHIHVDATVLSPDDYRATFELFFDEIAPVIRAELPSRSLAAAP